MTVTSIISSLQRTWTCLPPCACARPPLGEEVNSDTSVPFNEKHKERTHDGHNTVAPSPISVGVVYNSVLTDRLRNHRGFVKYFRQTLTFCARTLPKKQALLLNRAAANTGANRDTAIKAENEKLQNLIIRQLALHVYTCIMQSQQEALARRPSSSLVQNTYGQKEEKKTQSPICRTNSRNSSARWNSFPNSHSPTWELTSDSFTLHQIYSGTQRAAGYHWR